MRELREVTPQVPSLCLLSVDPENAESKGKARFRDIPSSRSRQLNAGSSNNVISGSPDMLRYEFVLQGLGKSWGKVGGKWGENAPKYGSAVEEFLPSIYIMAGRRYDPGYSAQSFSLFRGRLLEVFAIQRSDPGQ